MKVETAGAQDNAVSDQLQDEHRRYSEKLEGLSRSPYLSAEEQMEEIRLKKLKLRIKDQMAGNLPAYQFN